MLAYRFKFKSLQIWSKPIKINQSSVKTLLRHQNLPKTIDIFPNFFEPFKPLKIYPTIYKHIQTQPNPSSPILTFPGHKCPIISKSSKPRIINPNPSNGDKSKLI